MEKPYVTRTFTLTLRTTDTPTSNDASKRLAMVLKYAGRVQGFRCISSEEGNGKLIFDLIAHLRRQRDFSSRTFGPGSRSEGVVAHIRKELLEIEAEPQDLTEWIDVVLLALDGAWRAGYEPEEIAAALEKKQTRNEKRKWPDWRRAKEGAPIEHVKRKSNGKETQE